MIRPEHDALYQRLLAYEISSPGHEVGFHQHLMRLHGWDETFTLRAVQEYKKFIFLALVVDHRVSPSQQVDEVWHLHLICTESYWNDFCPNVLGHFLHHRPSNGAWEERCRHHQQYQATIASYREIFGEPPLDLWPPADLRFSPDLQVRRSPPSARPSPPRRSWWQRRGWLPAAGLIAAMALLAPVSAQTAISPAIPNSLRFVLGVPTLLTGLLFTTGLSQPRLIRPPMPPGSIPQLDTMEIAYLARDARGVEDYLLARMVHQGALVPIRGTRAFQVKETLEAEASLLEKEIHRHCFLQSRRREIQHADLLTIIRNRSRSRIQQMQLDMQQNQLLHSPRSSLKAALADSPIYILCGIPFVLGMLRLPIPPLLVFLYVVSGYIYMMVFQMKRVTEWGLKVLDHHEATGDQHDLLFRVALVGPTALVGGGFDHLRFEDLRIMLEEIDAEARQAAECCSSGCGGC